MVRIIALLLLAAPVFAQPWPNPVTATPIVLQDGFGAGGIDLPNDGLDYCVPTSTSMSLLYLGNAGFHQIAPANANTAQQLNLVRVMAGLMGSTPTGGTTGQGKPDGLAIYLAARGLGAPTTTTPSERSNAQYTFLGIANPTVADMAAYFAPPLQTGQCTAADIAIGWYKSTDGGVTYSRTGGHGLTLVGTQGSDTIILNNPAPESLARVPSLPMFAQQNTVLGPHLGTLNNTPGNPLRVVSTQFGPNGSTTNQAIILGSSRITIQASQLSSNNPVIQPWAIDTFRNVNTNGGDLEVIAALMDGAASGGIAKYGRGTLLLSNPTAVTTTNTFAAVGGVLKTTNATATPLGSGSVHVDYGTLELAPTAAATQSIAAAVNSVLRYQGGGTLALTPASGQTLNVTFGNASNSIPNLQRADDGTLVIATGGTALGTTVTLKAAGSGSTVPPLTHGIVTPSVVGQTTAGGNFLTYSETSGFTAASVIDSTSVDINSPTLNDTKTYAVTTPQTLNVGASVFALEANAPITNNTSTPTTLAVGAQTSGTAGVILNGGRIASTFLQFGVAQPVIYTGTANGTISSAITGSGGLVTFGPGTLILDGTSTYTGTTRVQSGILHVAGAITSPVVVNPEARLLVSGTVNGSVSAQFGGTVRLANGTINGPLSIDTQSTLSGNGTVNGAATISGGIYPGSGPGTTTFTAAATFDNNTFFVWKLFAFNDNTSASQPWNRLHFTGPGNGLNFGSSTNPKDPQVTLDIAGVPDPNSGNAFWNTSHEWTIITTDEIPASFKFGLTAATFEQGRFELITESTEIRILFVPVPEPATILFGVLFIFYFFTASFMAFRHPASF